MVVKTKQWYLKLMKRWMSMLEACWDPDQGVYGDGMRANAVLLPVMVILGQAGNDTAPPRARNLVEKLTSTPPWDPENHYWNNSWHSMGSEPHGAMGPLASGLSGPDHHERS